MKRKENASTHEEISDSNQNSLEISPLCGPSRSDPCYNELACPVGGQENPHTALRHVDPGFVLSVALH